MNVEVLKAASPHQPGFMTTSVLLTAGTCMVCSKDLGQHMMDARARRSGKPILQFSLNPILGLVIKSSRARMSPTSYRL